MKLNMRLKLTLLIRRYLLNQQKVLHELVLPCASKKNCLMGKPGLIA